MMVLLQQHLLIAAVAARVASAQFYPKSDDPTRITSAAESIDRSLRQVNLRSRSRTGAAEESNLLNDEHATTRKNLSPLSEVLPDPRIIGGIPARPNRYNFLASLNYYGSHICGGSLVALDMVLTAAHCSGYASTVELGRYDRGAPFNEDRHERIEVAYEMKHPEWDPKTVDNDFMLMKLVQPSEEFSTITLNTDPDYPSIPGEQLTLMGWGDTNPDPDVNVPSMQLLEIQLEFVPDNVCRAKEGTLDSGDVVRYENRLTENMLCAMDQDGARGDLVVDEDTCLGDSGSPMIIPRGGEDVQVGIVSWGIGCASPLFPGVYSRISSQYQWIRETVCRHSSVAPESFECDELGETGGSASPAFPLPQNEDDERSSVTLEVSLDENPQEFSWVVSTLSGGSGSSQLVAAIPPGFYSGYANYTFHHKLNVEPDQFYRISLRDTFGDGLKGYAAVYRGTVPILSNLIMYERLFYDKDRTDMKKIDHAFYTGKDPINYFSLAIRFDKFPRDTWWKLESETDGVIIMQRPPGWYNERFELMSIVETIPVFGARPDVVNYRFTIGDSYPCEDDPTEVCGDGICCNYGEGRFELFTGAVENNQLMASGGDYGLSMSVLVSPSSSVASS